MPTQNLKEFTEKEGTKKYRRQRMEKEKERENPKPKKVRNNMPTQNLRYKEKDGKIKSTKTKKKDRG